MGLAKNLELGNLDAERDWGHSKDYVKAMWLMLQQEDPEDYVVATGTSRTVRSFCEKAFGCVGLNYQDHVVTKDAFFRASEETPLRGDASKAKTHLGWERTTSFDQMVTEMVESDLAALKR